ncbi:MAG: TetR/AcrR family transcriptional regulator [Desulfovibrio sp.]
MTKRRTDILQAAIRLFARKGYDATPLAEIAREAEVSEGAIFRHFQTKEDLLHQIILEIRDNFLADIEKGFRFSSTESGLDMVLRLIRIYCRFYETRELEFDFIHTNDPFRMPHVGNQCRTEMRKIHDKMSEMLRIGITLGIHDGSIRPVPVETAAFLVISMLSGAVRMRIFENTHLTDIEAEFSAFCKNALRSGSLVKGAGGPFRRSSRIGGKSVPVGHRGMLRARRRARFRRLPRVAAS